MVPVQGQLPAEVVVVQKVLLVADLFLIDLLEDLADLVIVVGDKVEVRGKKLLGNFTFRAGQHDVG